MIDFFMHRYFRIKRSLDNLVLRLALFYYRIQAHQLRKKVVQAKGEKVLNRKLKGAIKAYCKERFGSSAYWPHLALLTELKGEFVEGWIPDDYFLYILEPKLNPKEYRSLGGQKTYDYQRFGEFAIKPLFLFVTGIFYNADFEVLNKNQLRKVLSDYNDIIVVKQEFGMGGEEVRIIHSSEFKPEQLQIGKNYVIQPLIKQHKILNDLYPESVNTIRVTTFLKKDGSIDIKFVIVRFGVDGLKVDNSSAGGKFINITPEGKGAKTAFDDDGLPAGEMHPNTGYIYSNLEIPMFQEVLDKCIAGHQKNPYVRMIGWDICINEHGEPKLIEWNTHRPGYTLDDALFGPFFTDDTELT